MKFIKLKLYLLIYELYVNMQNEDFLITII
jgi:hypothetical protein